MTEYGVLLVSGMRTHQEGHAAAFNAHPHCKVVAVADEIDVPELRSELNRKLAEQFGVPYIADLDEALALEDVQIVSMCADVERRGRVASRCALAGKHLYLDKPLAGTVEDARTIADAVQRAGVKAQMYSSIRSPFAQAAKKAVVSGEIGELKSVHAEVVFAKGRPGTVPNGTVRQEKEVVGRFTFVEAKREMFDIGVYAVALVHWLTGKKVESVFGITGNYVFAEHASHDIEDFGTMGLSMQDGVTATVVGGRFGWTSHPKGGPQRIVLIGTKGTLTFDAYRPRIEVYNDEADFSLPEVHALDPMGMWGSTQRKSGVMPKRRWMTTFDESTTMRDDVAEFIRCIEEDREPEMNPRTAVRFVEVILAGYASAAQGKEVNLPFPFPTDC